MLKGNRLEPYKFIPKSTTLLFIFDYANVEDCLPHIMQLLRAATLPTAEQNAMVTFATGINHSCRRFNGFFIIFPNKIIETLLKFADYGNSAFQTIESVV